MNKRLIRGILLAAVVGVIILTPGSFASPKPTPLDELETKLLAAAKVEVTFHIVGPGTKESTDLQGTLVIETGNIVSLNAKGSYFGRDTELSMRSDGAKMILNGVRGEQAVATPLGTNQALLIGLTRMGLLHNLFKLHAGYPPDHAEGGVQGWVVADKLTQEGETLSFGVVVAGKESGSAKLTLKGDTLLPMERKAVIAFTNREFKVTERYSEFKITPAK
jgi:hypothetical protein